jgi:hypothetical protein
MVGTESTTKQGRKENIRGIFLPFDLRNTDCFGIVITITEIGRWLNTQKRTDSEGVMHHKNL